MGRVWSDLVVVVLPAFQQAAGVREVLEDLLVQEFVAQPADEARDEGVLLGLARRDVVPVEPGPVGPRQDRARGQVRRTLRLSPRSASTAQTGRSDVTSTAVSHTADLASARLDRLVVDPKPTPKSH